MKKNFWQKIGKPFFVLAPMADVTDSAFRKIIAKYGKPDVMWTEFVSADGLVSKGKARLMHNLEYSNKERPIVAQLFSSNPEAMKKAASLVAELGFDGLDINMGCPDRSVEKQGAGAALIKNPQLAVEVIRAGREGVSKNPNFPPTLKLRRASKTQMSKRDNIPVSVKTRLGYNKIDWEWIKTLLEQRLPALTIHLRTRKEMSDVPAHWEVMSEIVRLRDEISPETLIIGNGDISTKEEGLQKIKETGCDGIMIGRGIFGKPWLFRDVVYSDLSRDYSRERSRETHPGSVEDRLKILLEHTKLFEKTFKNIKNFDVMKKHFKAYVNGWDGAKELRIKLMGCKNYKEVREIITVYNKGLPN